MKGNNVCYVVSPTVQITSRGCCLGSGHNDPCIDIHKNEVHLHRWIVQITGLLPHLPSVDILFVFNDELFDFIQIRPQYTHKIGRWVIAKVEQVVRNYRYECVRPGERPN